MTAHVCPVIGCEEPIASYLLVCSADWRRIPLSLRTKYEHAYRRAARKGEGITPELHELRAAVVEAASAARLVA